MNAVRQQLKTQLHESVMRLVTEQQLYLLSRPRVFHRDGGSRVAVDIWLERAQRRIFYRESTAGRADAVKPMRTIDISKIKAVSEGEGLAFQLLLAGENGMQDSTVGFVADCAESKALWVDGLILMCGLSGASAALMEEINRLLQVEVELRILEQEQDTKPPVPPPPADLNFVSGPLDTN